MTIQKSGGSVRKRVTRVLATGVLLFMYAFGMVATTGVFMTAGASSAFARGRGRGRGGGDIGLGIGLGIGAAVIGGAIAAQEAQRQDAIGYCMRRFRSYDPESMTYVGRDGLRHPCP
jgi:hypothetical protein